MKSIGFIGDTHGSGAVVVNILNKLKGKGITEIVHVGDFGFWPGELGRNFLHTIDEKLRVNGQTLYVTPGNHEDYTFLKHLKPREDGWLKAAENVLVAPRGHRWEWNGLKFVSLGGAPSVDRAWRLKFQRVQRRPVWWPEEAITDEDVLRTIAGGHADIMITHDAPVGVYSIESRIQGNPNGFTEEDLIYALEGRVKVRNAVVKVAPTMLFHGHYHFQVDDIFKLDDGSEVQVKGLAADGEDFSWGELDLETLDFEFGNRV